MDIGNNPFLVLRARRVALLFCGVAGGWVLLFLLLGAFRLGPVPEDDPLLAPLLYSLILMGLCGAIAVTGRRSPLRLAALLGPLPRGLAWGRLLGLVIGVFLFSLGAFQVFYLGLSLVAPGMMATALEPPALPSTQAPVLYRGLVLLSGLVVAPIAEEFIFRGILLHRWAVKWGLRPAIVLTSVLFGLLHANLVGLFGFGVVMALLYLSTRSLLVPMAAHALNNAIAFGVDWLLARPAASVVDPLAEFRASWWLGLLCLLVSSPLVLRYVAYHWPSPQAPLPYFANQGCRTQPR
jgi:membrane protease YdiL (CAAX protease family)